MQWRGFQNMMVDIGCAEVAHDLGLDGVIPAGKKEKKTVLVTEWNTKKIKTEGGGKKNKKEKKKEAADKYTSAFTDVRRKQMERIEAIKLSHRLQKIRPKCSGGSSLKSSGLSSSSTSGGSKTKTSKTGSKTKTSKKVRLPPVPESLHSKLPSGKTSKTSDKYSISSKLSDIQEGAGNIECEMRYIENPFNEDSELDDVEEEGKEDEDSPTGSEEEQDFLTASDDVDDNGQFAYSESNNNDDGGDGGDYDDDKKDFWSFKRGAVDLAFDLTRESLSYENFLDGMKEQNEGDLEKLLNEDSFVSATLQESSLDVTNDSIINLTSIKFGGEDHEIIDLVDVEDGVDGAEGRLASEDLEERPDETDGVDPPGQALSSHHEIIDLVDAPEMSAVEELEESRLEMEEEEDDDIVSAEQDRCSPETISTISDVNSQPEFVNERGDVPDGEGQERSSPPKITGLVDAPERIDASERIDAPPERSHVGELEESREEAEEEDGDYINTTEQDRCSPETISDFNSCTEVLDECGDVLNGERRCSPETIYTNTTSTTPVKSNKNRPPNDPVVNLYIAACRIGGQDDSEIYSNCKTTLERKNRYLANFKNNAFEQKKTNGERKKAYLANYKKTTLQRKKTPPIRVRNSMEEHPANSSASFDGDNHDLKIIELTKRS